MKLYHCFLIGIILFISIAQSNESSQCDQDITSDFIKNIENAEKLVVNGNGQMLFEMVYIDSIGRLQKALEEGKQTKGFENYILVNISNFSFKKQKIKYCRWCYYPHTKFEEKVIFAYDGNKTDMLQYDYHASKIERVIAGISPGKRVDEKYDPRYYGMTVNGIRIVDIMKCEKYKTVLLNGDEIIDEVSCKKIKAIDRENNATYIIWIAPSRQYWPVKIEIEKLRDRFIKVNYLKEYSNGVWFPSQIVEEKIRKSDSQIITRETLTLMDFEINLSKPDDFFSIDFPNNVNVKDFR